MFQLKAWIEKENPF